MLQTKNPSLGMCIGTDMGFGIFSECYASERANDSLRCLWFHWLSNIDRLQDRLRQRWFCVRFFLLLVMFKNFIITDSPQRYRGRVCDTLSFDKNAYSPSSGYVCVNRIRHSLC